ncbi:unnamed protein product [Darwinula stevensoni]|uniref:Ubiquitin fusion degradation protein 1 homolog n=1 Tax=Darwinula stevensoni TaxID=69355 RepID=A0A7R8X1N6_9CRUS|nr:unnamed protein product [Darwinula stevensoni]CAG0882407.1 unnamed protein product [Darwinula stevensoni]
MFGFHIFGEPLRPFNEQYRCYSVSMLPGNERHDVERGGKIIMPPSALDHLTRLNINYPMLFKLMNQKTNRMTHCGVLEFVAEEGKVFLPYWMMRNLLLEEGGMVQVESVTLPVATFSRFQPQATDFLDITNPKAVLENALRNFACLTTGDMIAINYNNKVYELCVLETRPGNAVTIIECDMNVDFAPPIGYQEPKKMDSKVSMDSEEHLAEVKGSDPPSAFPGEGKRLDGKKRASDTPSLSSSDKGPGTRQRGIPDYDYKPGFIRFIRGSRPSAPDVKKEEGFKAFSGEGKTLKGSKRIT